MGMPARWEISIIGVMSETTVRPAHATRERELVVGDLAAHAQDVGERALRAARQADVGDVDADLRHQVEQLELGLDVGVGDRGVLQPVAQRLVEERDALGDEPPLAADLVPVVDELGGGQFSARRRHAVQYSRHPEGSATSGGRRRRIQAEGGQTSSPDAEQAWRSAS